MTIYGPTKDLVKEAFWRVVDVSDDNQTGLDWLQVAEPSFWRGTMPGHIRDAEGWVDPPAPGRILPALTYVRSPITYIGLYSSS